ncbi:MAG: cupin-like domain-containing protein [Nonlabens sp.]
MDPRFPENPFPRWQRWGYNAFQFLDHFISRPVTVKLLGKLRYKLFLKMADRLKATGPAQVIEVERRSDLSIQEFKDYYLKTGVPVIFDGAASEWDCVKKWTPEYFKELHGEDEVPLIDSADFDKGIEFTTLSQLIDEIEKGNNKMYFRFYNLLSRHPQHLKDFDLNWLKSYRHKSHYFNSFQVFIGGENTTTGIHNAHISNLFVQCYGEKKWYLYPNHLIPFIDPLPTMNGIFRNAAARSGGKPFDPFQPDFEAYPYFKYLDSYKMTLRPGDVFYNPPFMWHTVKNNTKSIGVGYRWINAWHSFKSAPFYYILDLLAFRPNYFTSLRTVRKNANDQFIERFERYKKYQNK